MLVSPPNMKNAAMAGTVLIVGAGPSGLAALKEMREMGIDAYVVEMASSVGGVFRKDAVYEGLHLTISNRFMAFSDFPSELHAKYETSDEYVEYLEKYVSHFKLWDRISFNTYVKKAKMTMGKWTVEMESDGKMEVRTVDKLIVATGSNQAPKYAPVPGFTGEVMHSKDFTNAAAFEGKNVLVVGIGESSADIVAEIGKVAKSCTNWSRRPFLLGPRWLCPKSLDEEKNLTDKNERSKIWQLLETATTSRMSQIMSPQLYNRLRIGLWEFGKSKNSKDAFHLLCQLCLHGSDSVPHGWERSDQLFAITKSNRMPNAVATGDIDLLIAKHATFEGKKVRFDQCLSKNFDIIESGSAMATQEMDVDVIIMCTGYETKIDWIEVPYLNSNCRTWFKQSIPPGYEDSLAFLGWTRPHQGGIPCCSEMLSRYLALLWTGQRELPADWKRQIVTDAEVSNDYWAESPHYKTLVDYPSFMAAMAELIGCVPRPPSIFDLKGYIQYYTFPFWPTFYRSHGTGAKPNVLKSLLSQYGMFEAIGPLWPGQWHEMHPYTLIYGLLMTMMNPVFYLLSFLPGDAAMGRGWYWARSKEFSGLHGQKIRAKNLLMPILCWVLLIGGLAHMGKQFADVLPGKGVMGGSSAGLWDSKMVRSSPIDDMKMKLGEYKVVAEGLEKEVAKRTAVVDSLQSKLLKYESILGQRRIEARLQKLEETVSEKNSLIESLQAEVESLKSSQPSASGNSPVVESLQSQVLAMQGMLTTNSVQNAQVESLQAQVKILQSVVAGSLSV